MKRSRHETASVSRTLEITLHLCSVVCLTLLLGLTAHGQLSLVGQVTVSTTLNSESVQPAGDYVIVSCRQNGQQIVVNVKNPQAPTVCTGTPFNPAFGDQFADGLYSPIFGGRLFTAHRFGGINMIDASNLSATGCPMTQLATSPSNYSHEGLALWDASDCTSSPSPFLFYSEQHTASSGPSALGGLIIFSVGSTTLTQVGADLALIRGGFALDVSRDGNRCYQHVNSEPTAGAPNRFVVYDTTNKGAPAMCADVPMGLSVVPWADSDLELNADDTRAYVALGFDGMRIVDVTTPCLPTVSDPYPNTGLFFEGLTFWRKNILLVSIRGGGYNDFFVGLNVADATPAILSFHPTNLKIHDMKVQDGMVYIVGENSNGTDELQLWW